eukprot:2163387-Pleurochrysis_carterae.AAC.1
MQRAHGGLQRSNGVSAKEVAVLPKTRCGQQCRSRIEQLGGRVGAHAHERPRAVTLTAAHGNACGVGDVLRRRVRISRHHHDAVPLAPQRLDARRHLLAVRVFHRARLRHHQPIVELAQRLGSRLGRARLAQPRLRALQLLLAHRLLAVPPDANRAVPHKVADEQPDAVAALEQVDGPRVELRRLLKEGARALRYQCQRRRLVRVANLLVLGRSVPSVQTVPIKC